MVGLQDALPALHVSCDRFSACGTVRKGLKSLSLVHDLFRQTDLPQSGSCLTGCASRVTPCTYVMQQPSECCAWGRSAVTGLDSDADESDELVKPTSSQVHRLSCTNVDNWAYPIPLVPSDNEGQEQRSGNEGKAEQAESLSVSSVSARESPGSAQTPSPLTDLPQGSPKSDVVFL